MPSSLIKSAPTQINVSATTTRIFTTTTGHTALAGTSDLAMRTVPDGSGESLLAVTTQTTDNSDIGVIINLEDRLYSGRFALAVYLDDLASTSAPSAYAPDYTRTEFNQQRLAIQFWAGGTATNGGHFYNNMLTRGWNVIPMSRAMLANVARNGSATALPNIGGTGTTALSLGTGADGAGTPAATGSTIFDSATSGLQLRLRLYGAGAGTYSRMFIKEMVDNYHADSKTCLIFDDARATVYTDAFPLMQARGLVGVLPIISDLIGTAGYMTVAQVTELFNAGWDIVNHTKSHQTAATMAGYTQAQCLTEIQTCDAFIVANGWNRRNSSKYFVAPFGGMQRMDAVNYRAAITEAGVVASFGTTNRCIGGQLLSPFFIPRLDFNTLNAGTGYNITTMVNQYTDAVLNGASPMVMLHQFVNVPTDATMLPTSELETFLDRVMMLDQAGFTSVEGVTTAIPALTQGTGSGIRNLR